MAAILKNSRYSEDFDFEDCSNLDENEAVCYKVRKKISFLFCSFLNKFTSKKKYKYAGLLVIFVLMTTLKIPEDL